MLAGGSVVAGWDQLERAGPKDDRQVTYFITSCLCVLLCMLLLSLFFSLPALLFPCLLSLSLASAADD